MVEEIIALNFVGTRDLVVCLMASLLLVLIGYIQLRLVLIVEWKTLKRLVAKGYTQFVDLIIIVPSFMSPRLLHSTFFPWQL